MSVVSESDLTNFGTWWSDNKDKLFRYWVFRRMFTPYEQEKKFLDETSYEDDIASHGYIVEAVELPDGDILLGIKEDDEGIDPEREYITYYKLSEIRLAYCSGDSEEYDD